MSFSLSGIVDSVVSAVAPMVMDAVMPGSSELLGAANNLLGGAIGDVAKSIIDQVGKQMGAPKFLMDAAKAAVDGAVQDHSQPTNGDCTDHVHNKAGSIIDKLKQGMMNDFNDIFAEYKKDFDKHCGGASKGGKGESFLVVLAKLLGELENKQFDKVKKAGQDVSDALGTNGNTNSNENGQFDKMEKLKGESQTMSTLANSVSSALDGIFKAATTASQPR